MAKNRVKVAITPSMSKGMQQSIDNLSVIVGEISGSVNMANDMLTNISDVVEENLVKDILGNLTETQAYIKVAADMLIGIAGYLFGEKSLNYTTDYKALLNKVKNNSPILDVKPNKSFININNPVPKSKEKSASGKLTLVIKGLNDKNVKNLAEVYKELGKVVDISDESTLVILEDVVDTLLYTAKRLSNISKYKIDDNTVKLIKTYSKSVTAMNGVAKGLTSIAKYAIVFKMTKDEIYGLIDSIPVLIAGDRKLKVKGLLGIMNAIDKAESKGYNPMIIQDLFKGLIPIFNSMSKMGFSALKASLFKKSIVDSLLAIQEIVDQLNTVKITKKVKNSKEIESLAETFKNLSILFTSATKAGLFAFPASKLAKFIPKAVEQVIKVNDALASLKLEKSKAKTTGLKSLVKTFTELGKLFLIMSVVSIIAIPAFIGMLAAYGAVKLLSKIMKAIGEIAIDKSFKDAISGIKEIAKMMMIITGVMVVIVLLSVFATKHIKEILQFGLIFTGFLVVFGLIMIGLSWITSDKNMKNVGQFALLILTVAGIMVLSVLLSNMKITWGAIRFALELGMFVLLFGAIFAVISLITGKKVLHSMKSFTILIAVTAGVLIIGALFIQAGLGEPAKEFAKIVAFFILGVVAVFALAGKKLVRAMKAMVMLTILIVATAAIMILGAYVVSLDGMKDNLVLFVSVTAGFILGMGIIAFLIGTFQEPIKKGIVGLFAIIVLIILSTVALKKMAEAMAIVGDSAGEKLLIAVGIIAATIVAIALIAVGLGAVMNTGIGAVLFAAGAAALAAVVAIAYAASEAMLNIGNAMKIMHEVTSSTTPDESAKAEQILNQFTGLCKVVGDIGDKIDKKKVLSTTEAMLGVVNVISGVAQNMKDMADLKVPIAWDNDGKPTKWRNIQPSDFDLVSTNVVNILTALTNAVFAAYDAGMEIDPKMFNKNLFGQSKIMNVIDTMMKMTSLIGSGAQALKDIADMAYYYTDENGKNVRVIISEEDLKPGGKVEKSVKNVISCLGSAIQATYDLYKPTFLGKNWFVLGAVSTAVTKMSEVISKVVESTKSIVDVFSNEKLDESLNKFKSTLKSIFDVNTYTDKDTADDAKTLFESMNKASANLVLVSRKIKTFTSDIVNAFSNIQDVDPLLQKWNKTISGVFNPKDVDLDTTKMVSMSAAMKDFSATEFTKFVNSVNSLDIQKVDKMINLSNSIMNLSSAMRSTSFSMNIFIAKLKYILDMFDRKLSKASKELKDSEKNQDKRKKAMEELLEDVREIFNGPDNLGFGGGGQTTQVSAPAPQNNSGTNNTPDIPYTPNQSMFDTGNIELKNISGTTSDIHDLLKAYIESLTK